MGRVKPWVGFDWIGLGRDFFLYIFGGLGWIVGPKWPSQHVTFRVSATQLPTSGIDFPTGSEIN